MEGNAEVPLPQPAGAKKLSLSRSSQKNKFSTAPGSKTAASTFVQCFHRMPSQMIGFHLWILKLV